MIYRTFNLFHVIPSKKKYLKSKFRNGNLVLQFMLTLAWKYWMFTEFLPEKKWHFNENMFFLFDSFLNDISGLKFRLIKPHFCQSHFSVSTSLGHSSHVHCSSLDLFRIIKHQFSGYYLNYSSQSTFSHHYHLHPGPFIILIISTYHLYSIDSDPLFCQ